MVMYIKIIFHW